MAYVFLGSFEPDNVNFDGQKMWVVSLRNMKDKAEAERLKD